MVTDNSVTRHAESLAVARERIRIGPVPEWVAACPLPGDVQAAPAGHVTHLLFDRQIHAGLGQTFFHVARRLDSMQAVQNESPWRLDFESRHQRITLHWIKTRRGDAQFDHANLSSVRVVDRQAAGVALPDRLTLSLMLDDIRPGDILEWCYTVDSKPALLPGHCAALFTLPQGTPVGKFYFSLRFDPARPMRWKSSVPEWQPDVRQNDGETLWIWTQENYPGLSPEANTPEWHVAQPWIQISDCLDWGTVAAAFAEAWKDVENDAPVPESVTGDGSLLKQAEQTIQMVREEYRYLAVDGEVDGQRPNEPEVVMRRRYGDAKDLSFLLVRLLKRLGVPARLVLVNTNFRKSVEELLPAPGVFNHLLVEYQAGGETPWVDAALKQTGNGSPIKAARDYGAGLPVAALSSNLVEPPDVAAKNSVLELNESILLDTTGVCSWLGVVVAARGSQAAALRQELETEGLEAFSKKRLRLYAERFNKVKRAGPLQYRDDPAANEFFMAEIFEIADFLTVDSKSKWFKLDLTNDYIAGLLPTPEAGPRRAPFALPHPCNVMHTIELHSVALPPANVQQRTVESEFLHFTRLRKTLAGYWTMKLTLSTLADAVPPEGLEKHREAIEEVREQSGWSLLVPAGDPRPRERGDFGALPVSWEPTAMPTPSRPRPLSKNAAAPAPALENSATPPAPSTEPETGKSKRRKRGRRKRDPEMKSGRPIFLACMAALVLIAVVIWVAKNAEHWGIFKVRPEDPVAPSSTLPTQ